MKHLMVFLLLVISSQASFAQTRLLITDKIDIKDTLSLRGSRIGEISKDTALPNSDLKISTSRAIRRFIENRLAAGGSNFGNADLLASGDRAHYFNDYNLSMLNMKKFEVHNTDMGFGHSNLRMEDGNIKLTAQATGFLSPQRSIRITKDSVIIDGPTRFVSPVRYPSLSGADTGVVIVLADGSFARVPTSYFGGGGGGGSLPYDTSYLHVNQYGLAVNPVKIGNLVKDSIDVAAVSVLNATGGFAITRKVNDTTLMVSALAAGPGISLSATGDVLTITNSGGGGGGGGGVSDTSLTLNTATNRMQYRATNGYIYTLAVSDSTPVTGYNAVLYNNTINDFAQIRAGVWSSGVNTNGLGISNLVIAGNGNISYRATYTGAINQYGIIGFKANNTPEVPYYDYLSHMLYVDNNGKYIAGTTGLAETNLNSNPPAAQAGDIYQISRINGQIVAQYFRSNTWFNIFTFSATSTNVIYMAGGTQWIGGPKELNNPQYN